MKLQKNSKVCQIVLKNNLKLKIQVDQPSQIIKIIKIKKKRICPKRQVTYVVKNVCFAIKNQNGEVTYRDNQYLTKTIEKDHKIREKLSQYLDEKLLNSMVQKYKRQNNRKTAKLESLSTQTEIKNEQQDHLNVQNFYLIPNCSQLHQVLPVPAYFQTPTFYPFFQ